MAKNSGATTERKIAGVPINTRTIVIVVVAILAVWFILMNTASVKIHLWGLSTFSAPLWIVLLVMIVVGALLGWALRRYRDRADSK
ncbi:LapA family protein [Streptacidiphilus cavernicola]|uniref:LapA family protein n=1 Tax=Streptacidiphilus cavernicola TaxID=3342716 RepID=A0ABV6VYW0_9ACTN